MVQRTLGALGDVGYCVDFVRLDAADYGVPQRRIRPFWYGHGVADPHIVWPERTHAPPADCRQPTLPTVRAMLPWVTCRQALEHLPQRDLGRPVRLRYRGQNGAQQGSVPDKPARVVGTSNLSDGNVLVHPDHAMRKDGRAHRHPGKKARASRVDEPAGVVTASENGDGNTLLLSGLRSMVVVPHHPPSQVDEPSRTIRASSSRTPDKIITGPYTEPSLMDGPSRTVRAAPRGEQTLLVSGAHPAHEVDAPAGTIAGCGKQRAQILTANSRHPISTPDAPSRTVCTKGDMQGGQGAAVLAWPWDRPSTTVTTRHAIPPPGHHPESGSILSLPNAVKLSEKAAAILQGFPRTWLFSGKTKASRWAQIGMAMPPPLAEAVGRSIARALGLAPAPPVEIEAELPPQVAHG